MGDSRGHALSCTFSLSSFTTLILLILLASLAQKAQSSQLRQDKYAFVTIHYEGTASDAEYVLGVRVLLKSLQPLHHPFIILVSDNVSQRSRDLFSKEGATLIDVRYDMIMREMRLILRASHSLTHFSIPILLHLLMLDS